MAGVKKSLKQENDFGFIKKEPLDEDFKNELNQFTGSLNIFIGCLSII